MEPEKLSDVHRELVYEKCCKTLHREQRKVTVLEIDISIWHEFIDEFFLISAAKMHEEISLVMNSISHLREEVWKWLQKHISTKLIEVSFVECNSFSWKAVKKLLESSTKLESVNFKSNTWVTDQIVEQLSIRFSKTLRELNLEHTKITDNALFHIGRRCQNLREISLDCCNNISNSGLIELSRRLHLSAIHLSHNMSVTDVGIEKVLSNSHSLSTIRLTNCPKLTDRSVGSLYEAVVSWGKKRNTKAQHLKTLEIRDNPNLTAQVFGFISAALPALESLDLRDCPGIDLARGLSDIEVLHKIEKLYLGPTACSVDSNRFVQSLLYQIPNLRVLHLAGLGTLSDTDMAEVFASSLVLEEIILIDIPIGRRTIEELCSNVPNLSKVTFCGTSLLGDAEVRCLSCICCNITELALHRCSALSDEAFNRGYSLKRLTKLDLSSCSSALTGQLLSYFLSSPLESLALDGLKVEALRDFMSDRAIKSYINLTHVSLKGCQLVDMADVSFLLSLCPYLCTLDLTDCVQLLPDVGRTVHCNPFLTYSYTTQFMGFSAGCEQQARRVRTQQTMLRLREHYGAKLLQRLRKTYLKARAAEPPVEAPPSVPDEEDRAARIIQVVYREWHRRRMKSKQARAAFVLLRVMHRFLTMYIRQRNKIADAFYAEHLRRRSFKALVRAAQKSYRELVQRAEKLNPVLAKRLKNSTFYFLKTNENGTKEKRLCDGAEVLWEEHIMYRLVRAWRLLLGESTKKNTLLTKVFINCVNIKTLNSTKQKADVAVAIHFCDRRIIAPAWLAFVDDYRRACQAELLLPKALSHYRQAFAWRVLKPCFVAILKYSQSRRGKRLRKLKADKHKTTMSSRAARVAFANNINRRRKTRLDMQTATLHHPFYQKLIVLKSQFPSFQHRMACNRDSAARASRHYDLMLSKRALQTLVHRLMDCRFWKMMVRRVTRIYRRRTLKKVQYAWRSYALFMRNVEQYVKGRYNRNLMMKAILSLRRNVFDQREYLSKLSRMLARQAQSADALNKFIRAMVVLQSRMRSRIARRKVREFRASMVWSAQVLQNFVRRALAAKELLRRKRVFEINEAARADRELDLMRQEEAEMAYYKYCVDAVIGMQKIFRGWKGRIRAREIIERNARLKGMRAYEEIEKAHLKYEREQREAYFLAQVMYKAACVIQSHVRGVLSRRRFLRLVRDSKRYSSARKIQRLFRRHQGRLLLEALKRDRLDIIRYRAARKQRGYVMRSLGVSKRKNQRLLSRVLDFFGFEPFSFNYRLDELMIESRLDMSAFFEMLRREYSLFKTYRGAKLPTLIGRKHYLENRHVVIEKEDAVRIISPGHRFFGFTGIVVKVDPTVFGHPLYEIKLDHFTRQTYVQMSRDAIDIYDDHTHQPLGRINRYPMLHKVSRERDKYNAIAALQDTRYSRAQALKAATIQRAWRSYRAKKIAARKRYEFWHRAAMKQRSLLHLLKDRNIMTTHGYHVGGFIGLRSQRRVEFSEIRHEIVPARIKSNGRGNRVGPAIRREFAKRYQQRLRFLERAIAHEKVNVFQIGATRLHLLRRFKMFLNLSFGMMMRSAKMLGNLRGFRGTKYIAGHKGLVTGLNRFYFEQFEGSPHVRFPRASLYQGEWNGIPLFTSLKPHGEGLAIFFDCFGFGREDKVLKLSILNAKRLIAADILTSDPYCDIFCNGKNVQTTIKYTDLNPVWNEYFELDVTDPYAVLQIVVMDFDYVGSNDFLGQVVIYLAEIPFNTSIRKTFQLKGKKLEEDEGFDRGELEIEMIWCDRFYEDDFMLGVQRTKDAIRIQAWARSIIAKELRRKLALERDRKMEEMLQFTIQIQCLLRRRLAWKEYRRRLRLSKAALKIQMCVRCWLSRRVLYRKRLEKEKATLLQCAWLCYVARCAKIRLRAERQLLMKNCAILIQKTYRRDFARKLVYRIRVERKGTLLHEQKYAKNVPVSEWLKTYGRDTTYGLRRTRRIVERVFKQMLLVKFSRFVTRFGHVFLDSYPPRVPDDEGDGSLLTSEDNYNGRSDSEDDDDDETIHLPLTVPEDFVEVFVPKFHSTFLTRHRVINRILKVGAHRAYFHLPSTIQVKESVEQPIISIQCWVRRRKAHRMREKLQRLLMAIICFQRAFRKYNKRVYLAALRVQSLFRFMLARRAIMRKRRDRLAACCLQRAWRCHRARIRLYEVLSVRGVQVLKVSSFKDLNGPDKCFDFRDDTFWMSDSKDVAEVRVELPKKLAIESVWILASTHASSPKFVSLSVVLNKKSRRFEAVVTDYRLPKLRGQRWHKIHFPSKVSKYFKLKFCQNFGDEDSIAIRQIRFIKTKESKSSNSYHDYTYVLLYLRYAILRRIGNHIKRTKSRYTPVWPHHWRD